MTPGVGSRAFQPTHVPNQWRRRRTGRIGDPEAEFRSQLQLPGTGTGHQPVAIRRRANSVTAKRYGPNKPRGLQFVATPSIEGDRDFSFTIPGELVHLPPLTCQCPDCGCDRAMAGFVSHKATTSFVVRDLDLDPDTYSHLLFDTLKAGGWVTGGSSADTACQRVGRRPPGDGRQPTGRNPTPGGSRSGVDEVRRRAVSKRICSTCRSVSATTRTGRGRLCMHSTSR